MSYKLSDLQDIAEKKGKEYAKPMVCLHATARARSYDTNCPLKASKGR